MKEKLNWTNSLLLRQPKFSVGIGSRTTAMSFHSARRGEAFAGHTPFRVFPWEKKKKTKSKAGFLLYVHDVATCYGWLWMRRGCKKLYRNIANFLFNHLSTHHNFKTNYMHIIKHIKPIYKMYSTYNPLGLYIKYWAIS